MMATERAALETTVLRVIAGWSGGGPGCDEAIFDAAARALFAYQVACNAPYARFAATLGFQGARMPETWREIPAVPASAFKDATLATFDVRDAELEFHTSGTTAESSGKHYVARAALYDRALAAGFDRFMLPDRPRIRFLVLAPNSRLQPHSSLGYMLGQVAVLRGDGAAGYFLEGDALDIDGFVAACERACAEGAALCVAGTAFAFVALLDELAWRGRTFAVPAGSRVMETGGFKGRVKAVPHEELYARLEGALGIPQTSIVAEYGMTELLSQFYDSPASRAGATRIKVGPPWLRTLVVGADGRELPAGETGFLRHVDLANVGSAVAVQTEDRGYALDDGFVLLGRDLDAPPRGCSLDAEQLHAIAK